ncbi:MAG: bifunctional tRNA (5-methylaminomethyl-2-thiouridine)(34)-methyltransferase MnmD/FAD-dependent 5-carboxymethylaminomethyl-2-thiouridine(34) oxidoreductase MnmC [Parvularculaceae bacterium]
MKSGRVVDYARLDWTDGVPRSADFDDIYFSGYGLSETRHVFLDGNDLARRFDGAPGFSIGELGFGSGLNMLAVADLWRNSDKQPGARLNLFSVECAPFDPQALARAHRAWPELDLLSDALLENYPPPLRGFHSIDLADDVTLTLGFGDANALLKETDGAFDAWFFDGFAPAKNPDLWSPELFDQISRLSAPTATFATFSVAGAVRRALGGAGFQIEKRPGFGRKKEMLAGRLLEKPRARQSAAPWFDRSGSNPLKPGAKVAVIGGGIAGASLAFSLRATGLQPTVFDPNGIAAGASGNPAGLIMPRIDLGDNAASQFFAHAYVHSIARLRNLSAAGNDNLFNPCGVLQKFKTEDEKHRAERILAERILPVGWVEKCHDGGLFFPQGGVVDPGAYCKVLIGGAELISERVSRICDQSDSVDIHTSAGLVRSFDGVIVANSIAALSFSQCRTLPLTPVRGQIDFFSGVAPPARAITYGSYAATAPGGGAIIGATYDHSGTRNPTKTSVEATQENIAAASALIDIALLEVSGSTPRASLRCQTPDRLPVAGPIPDWDYFSAQYDGVRTGAKGPFPPAQRFANVFILAGLGSRGFVTAPYCADIIAAAMTGRPAPAERMIADALDPARFFIREMKRTRTIRAQ